MKKLLLSCLMLLGMTGANLQAETEIVNLTFGCAGYCHAQWDGNTFTWGTAPAWGWGEDGWVFMTANGISEDLTAYTSLHLKVQDFTNASAGKLKVVFQENTGSTPPNGLSVEADLIPNTSGIIDLDLNALDWKGIRNNIYDMSIYGCDRDDESQPASVKVTEAYMVKEVADVEEPFEEPALPEGGVVVKEIDYTTQTKYPYYWMGDKEDNKDLQPYFANGTATVQIMNHALEITNTSDEGEPHAIQPFIIDNANIKKGYDYIIRVIYKSNAAGNININFGKWNPNVAQYNIAIKGTNDYEVLDVKFEKISIETSGNDAHVLWQSRKLVGTTRIYKVQVIEIAPDDPLLTFKEDLQAAIAMGNAQNSFAKTTGSFDTLTDAITAAETALADEDATEESLTAAKTAITDAIAGLKLQDGYTNLTSDMFKHWNDNNNPTTSSSTGCAYDLNISTGMPYGDSNVHYLNFADVSDFNKLFILINAGQARVQMNRLADPENKGETKIFTKGDAVSSVDFATDLADFDFAHINAIKDNWGKVTVSGMYLYRTFTVSSDAGMASFGTLYKTANLSGANVYAAKYADGKVTLTTIESGNVPAGKGVIVEGSGEIVPTFDVEADAIDTDLLVSNGTVTGDGSTIFVLAKKNDVVGFYKLKEGDNVPAGKAYLKIAATSREFIAIDGGATAIKSVETENANGAIYNLAGQQVKSAQKGIFIMNGKKVIK